MTSYSSLTPCLLIWFSHLWMVRGLKEFFRSQVQVRRYVVRVDVLNVFINAAFGQRLLIDECVVARPKIYYAI